SVISHIIFREFRIFIPLSGILLGVVVCGNAVILFDFILERYQRSRISAMFGTYVSPDLVNSIIQSGEEPTLGGEEVDITCFFSDVQGFSSISEQLTPGRLVELMNEYLTAMTGVLDEHGGTLDKYVGDGIVAMFGAPIQVGNHARQACLAALAMQRAQCELRRTWQSAGAKWPDQCQAMRTRIGLNSGVVTVGNMGSEKRFNYTAMGDNVNLAARCESAARYYGIYIMAAEETRTRCLAHSCEIAFRFIDNIVVRGRLSPVAVYEVMGLKAEMSGTHLQLLEAWPDAVARYLNRDWSGAIQALEKCREWEPLQPGRDAGVKTTPSEVLIARCRVFAANDPGPGWNGVCVLTGK
ncbi:MAG: adenylate/guanylate cyclase domain-containing protein, partial [bacterium]